MPFVNTSAGATSLDLVKGILCPTASDWPTDYFIMYIKYFVLTNKKKVKKN